MPRASIALSLKNRCKSLKNRCKSSINPDPLPQSLSHEASPLDNFSVVSVIITKILTANICLVYTLCRSLGYAHSMRRSLKTHEEPRRRSCYHPPFTDGRGKQRLNALKHLEPEISPELTLPPSMLYRPRGLRGGDE